MYIVTCEYCKKEINTKGISTHLKKVHAVEFIDYLKTHRNDFPKYKDCEVCGTLIHAHSSGKSATCSVACSKQLRATWVGEKNPRKGIKHTDRGKRNISNAKKRYYEHNIHPMLGKQHTTDAKQKMSRTRIDNKLSVGERNGMYGKTHSDEAREKQKQKAKGRFSLEWYIDRYGQNEGTQLYTKRCENLRNRKLNRNEKGVFIPSL